MEDTRLAVTIAWALWTNRNDMIHGKLRKTSLLLVDWCRSYLGEYQPANNTLLKQPTQLEVNPPIFPSFKINVDVVVFSPKMAASVGVIIHDHKGNFIAGLSKKIHAPLGTNEVEAKAFEARIIFAKEVGIRDFVLEGDSQVIVQALKECSLAQSSASALVYGMLAECNEFRNVGFSHVR